MYTQTLLSFIFWSNRKQKHFHQSCWKFWLILIVDFIQYATARRRHRSFSSSFGKTLYDEKKHKVLSLEVYNINKSCTQVCIFQRQPNLKLSLLFIPRCFALYISFIVSKRMENVLRWIKQKTFELSFICSYSFLIFF